MAETTMTKEKCGLLLDGADDAKLTFLFAHGAGAPMDAPFMSAFARGLGERGIRVVRFEFDYMKARRQDGKRRPPARADKLLAQFRAAIDEIGPAHLVIGGKSMGGRMASLLLSEAPGVAHGLICLGYPFHPPGKPDHLRTAHLETIEAPTLICQGERDAFGSREEVEALHLSPAIKIHWAPDGNHDLSPRKKSGFTQDGNWRDAMEAIGKFINSLG